MAVSHAIRKMLCALLALLALASAASCASLAADEDKDSGSGDAAEEVTGITEEELGALKSQLQKLGGKIADMSDEELEQEIRSFLDRAKLDLTDRQVEKIAAVIKSAGESAENISEKTESVSETVGKLQKIKDAVVWFFQMIWAFLKTVFSYISGFIGKYA